MLFCVHSLLASGIARKENFSLQNFKLKTVKLMEKSTVMTHGKEEEGGRDQSTGLQDSTNYCSSKRNFLKYIHIAIIVPLFSPHFVHRTSILLLMYRYLKHQVLHEHACNLSRLTVVLLSSRLLCLQ